jgi:acyl-CoA dehydrogenase
VEGANILTRTMIIFGQGAIRCHPYLLKEMTAAVNDDGRQARIDFDKAVFGHIGYNISNKVRAWTLGITGARLMRSPVSGPLAYYYRQLSRMSAAFAFVADIVLLTFGGKFKFKEKLSGRLADVLAHLYMASAVLKKFEDEGRHKEDLPLVHWALQDSLKIIQDQLLGVLRNYPVPALGALLRWLIFPLGLPYAGPTDSCGKHVARILLSANAARDRLIGGVYKCNEEEDPTGVVHCAFDAVLESAAAERALKNALKRTVSTDNYRELVLLGLETGVITEEQGAQVRRAQELTISVVEVDDFPRAHLESGYAEPEKIAPAKTG